MGTQSKAKQQNRERQRKGRFLEKIAALMHQELGVSVQTNVRLPTHRGGRRDNEIDILVTGVVSGTQVRIAIECKNESKPIGKGMIQQFKGKLDEVGIPSQFGRFVSTSRYTRGAESSAAEAGIRVSTSRYTRGAESSAAEAGISLLLLSGLDDKKASAKILDALQTVVYLVATGTEVAIASDAPEAETPELLRLFDSPDAGEPFTLVPEMMRSVWMSSRYFRDTPGRVYLRFTPKDSVYQMVAARPVPVRGILATVSVAAIAIEIVGKFSHTSLVNVRSGKAEKQRVEAKFDPAAQLRVRTFADESALRTYIASRPERLKLTIGRVKLPRIAFRFFWPPSSRVWQTLKAIWDSAAPDDEVTFADMEPSADSLFETGIPMNPRWSDLETIERHWEIQTRTGDEPFRTPNRSDI